MDAAQVLAYLHAQRDRIVNAIAALEAMGWTAATKLTGTTASKTAAPAVVKSAKTASSAATKKRTVSPEARQRMAEAQQKRWAKKKRAVKAVAKKAAVVPAAEKPAKKAPKKAVPKKAKGGITAAARKKMSEAAKARWAAKKAAAQTA